MSFRDLEDFLDPTLKLPIRGKTYTVQSPDARTGLHIQAIFSAARDLRAGEDVGTRYDSLILDDDEERDEYQRALGATWDEMADDGLPLEYVEHAGRTVMIWVAYGKQAAERYWNGGGDPKAKKRRKGGAKKGRPDSGATSTPPASPTASTSDGPTSSPTGD